MTLEKVSVTIEGEFTIQDLRAKVGVFVEKGKILFSLKNNSSGNVTKVKSSSAGKVSKILKKSGTNVSQG